ncbi:MAG: hypothetical protein RBR16_05170 [Syntrophus sp. (in: bacteria)]|nr:hypothetical protein [Syntrophus sp. (in: bacteria)]
MNFHSGKSGGSYLKHFAVHSHTKSGIGKTAEDADSFISSGRGGT